MFDDEIGQGKTAASYADACLTRGVVDSRINWPREVRAFVLDRVFRWLKNDGSFADESDAVRLDS